MSETTAPAVLSAFEGRLVTRSRIEIPGAAGGLRDALDVEPVEVAIDEIKTLVLRVRCKKVRFDEIKDSDCLARVQIFEPLPGEAAFAEGEYETAANLYISGQAERIRRAQERRAGVLSLLDGEAGDEDGEPFGHEPDDGGQVDNRDGHADEWSDGDGAG